MVQDLLTQYDDGQINAIESLKHGFGSGAIRGTFGVSRIQARQFVIQIRQALASSMFNQGQDAQPKREQADQSGGASIALQIHGRQGEACP